MSKNKEISTAQDNLVLCGLMAMLGFIIGITGIIDHEWDRVIVAALFIVIFGPFFAGLTYQLTHKDEVFGEEE